ncbi:MAG: FtsK/SpoIIIE domain-containing protein [Beutenbergiaceae bacterium]
MSLIGTRYHLAVVDGPDCGWVTPLPDHTEVVVGRGTHTDLPLRDPALSRRHLAVRVRGHRITARRISGAGKLYHRRTRRRRSGTLRMGRRSPLGTRRRRLRAGAQIRAGQSTIEVRMHPGFEDPAQPVRATDSLAPRLLIPLAMAATMVPLALSSGTGTLRTLTWLVLPIALVIAALWPWLIQRARRRREKNTETDPQPPDPAQLLATAAHPWHRPASDWDLGGIGRRRKRVRTMAPLPAGHGLALVGHAAAATAMARWLLCQLVHAHGPEELGVVVPAAWDWAAQLPHLTGSAAPELAIVVLDHSRHEPQQAMLAPGQIGIVIAESLAQVPPWCSQVIEVGDSHDRRVSIGWASEVCAALAFVARHHDQLPTMVRLQQLGIPDTASAVADNWRHRPTGLAAPIGVTDAGTLTLDLAASGPHALIAGTTGSGKSELLTTLVLGLALRHPPCDLYVLLVDYKGGATFGAVATLPHVIDVLTDLDTAGTARALASLRAELARRERVLAGYGARSLSELLASGAHLPRLLVIVDEFRTLADSHPDLLDALVRLAAQGRSLGIHLVLATQRPAGAVSADMRANMPIRISLQVLEPSDSLDVLGDTSATALPPVPGRAIVRTDRATTLQVAWPGSIDDGVPALVELVRDAASRASAGEPSLVKTAPPWAPALPEQVLVRDLDADPSAGLPLLLTDLPDEQRLGTWCLPPGNTLLVSGPPGSGRSSAARAIATEAVRRGIVTDVIAAEQLAPAAAPALGTVCDPQDVRRAVRVLSDARPSGAGDGPRLVVLDDTDVICHHLDQALGFGKAQELVTALLRSARNDLTVALTCTGRTSRWATLTRNHLMLTPHEVGEAMAAGVPRELVTTAGQAGRGVLLTAAGATLAQVGLADPTGPWQRPNRDPRRLLALPSLVSLPPETGVPHGVLVGLGGDHAGPVWAKLPDGGVWAILGPAASGRSTALAMLTARLNAAGRTVVSATDATSQPGIGSASVLAIDDADRLSPATAAGLTELVQQHRLAVIATARPDPLGSAYHELARRLRNPDLTLVLGSPAGTGPWTGADLRGMIGAPAPPGHGVLVSGGRAVALTVDRGRS